MTNNQQQIEAPTSESECNLIGYDPFDLASGLPQRNYGRSDVKVYVSQLLLRINENNHVQLAIPPNLDQKTAKWGCHFRRRCVDNRIA